MGQKVNPVSLRLSDQSSISWLSNWYSKDNYLRYLHEDLKIRLFLKGYCYFHRFYIGDIYIWRPTRLSDLCFLSESRSFTQNFKPKIQIYFNIFIPVKRHLQYSSWESKNLFLRNVKLEIYNYLSNMFEDFYEINLSIDPILESVPLKIQSFQSNSNQLEFDLLSKELVDEEKNVEFLIRWLLHRDASMLSQWISDEIQKRKGIRDIFRKLDIAYSFFRRVEKNYDSDHLFYTVKGIKVSVSGRFLMTDNEKRRNKMARIKSYKRGRISLHTLSEKINYSNSTAYTVDGTSGIKVWICYN